jgi:hypothetical protein
MDTRRAAENTLTIWKKNLDSELPTRVRCVEGMTLEHQHWLLHEVEIGNVVGEKAHGWLSFAQGVLVSRAHLSLTDCKYANLFS